MYDFKQVFSDPLQGRSRSLESFVLSDVEKSPRAKAVGKKLPKNYLERVKQNPRTNLVREYLVLPKKMK